MKDQFSSTLQDCLQALAEGQALETILSHYPGQAAALRPLLETALGSVIAGQLPIPAGVQTRSRLRVLAAAARLRKARKTMALAPVWRVSFAALAAVAFVFLSGNGLLKASAVALPGEPFYNLKLSVEKIQLTFSSPAEQQQLQGEFYQRRLEETETLLGNRQLARVEFEGEVTAFMSDGWVVSGIRVVADAHTQVRGAIGYAAQVQVKGVTQENGFVLADEIRLEQRFGESGSHSGGEPEAPEATETPREEHESTSSPEPESQETPEPGDSSGSGNGSGSGASATEDKGEGSGSGSGSGEATKTPKPEDDHH